MASEAPVQVISRRQLADKKRVEAGVPTAKEVALELAGTTAAAAPVSPEQLYLLRSIAESLHGIDASLRNLGDLLLKAQGSTSTESRNSTVTETESPTAPEAKPESRRSR